MTNKEYVDGLRAFADWVEAHDEVPTPPYPEIGWWHLDEKREAEVLVRALGRCDKEWSDTMLNITRAFGPIVFKAGFYRQNVCERRVVGVRRVEQEIIPERVVPAHNEEVVEWDCHPLLSPEPEGEEQPEEDAA